MNSTNGGTTVFDYETEPNSAYLDMLEWLWDFKAVILLMIVAVAFLSGVAWIYFDSRYETCLHEGLSPRFCQQMLYR